MCFGFWKISNTVYSYVDLVTFTSSDSPALLNAVDPLVRLFEEGWVGPFQIRDDVARLAVLYTPQVHRY